MVSQNGDYYSLHDIAKYTVSYLLVDTGGLYNADRDNKIKFGLAFVFWKCS